MTRAARVLTPTMQGPIDGLCGVYTVVNSCKLLGILDGLAKLQGEDEPDPDERLFAAICKSEITRPLFPKIVWDGTEGPGMARILEAARRWSLRASRRVLAWESPRLHRRGGTIENYFDALRDALRPDRGERKAFILGLAKPWNHWTVVRGVDENDVRLFDSWGFPARDTDKAPIRDFTFDPHARGVKSLKRHVVDTKAGFLLTSLPK